MLAKDIMSKEIYYVKVPGNRTQALEIMRKKNVSGLPVVKEGSDKLVGVITRSDIIENPDEEQIALIMTRDPIVASPEDPVSLVASKMVENNIRRIPIVENDKLVGIITAYDIVSRALTEMDIDSPVEDYMILNIPTTWDRTPLNIAFEIMRYFKLKVLLTINNEARLSGILTETDFLNESEVVSERTVHNTSVGTEGDRWTWDSKNVLYVIKNQLRFSDKEVRDVATTEIVTVTKTTSVSNCAKKMRKYKIEQIPVIDFEGELVGLLRAQDLIKALVDSDE
ncbi:MAG TPA: CBS domain-containing protein [Methanothermobacter sp.]|jgi:CBS domain-containing protein|uniref:Inosine-5-monophosphate dehydrogenase n=1 Tax=Methanothermobacter tenebrarum TaxID=680118 RepID=A0ABM7YCJ0_9EURY|nr:CBS domain-containing protein [Methanothermobacter tenebrarum]MDI6881947.1 CBS domain-containing protein [Methanothermobacter sp.]MDX9693396.1 CBS domain-containing protein [Methanothermobacter sp.]BDH79051.1 inosine-5-monophosphate dehydrogenase [Methanothermobacter tenebrarum]HHW16948.1 CBS domain-containing protein [Methanothermobacter sp.]HOQ20077.1 CBS domain-containing protein [Methanothermobacter sp.]